MSVKIAGPPYMMYDIIPMIAKDGEIVKKKIDQPLTALARKSAEEYLSVFWLLF
jgi:hypothetical protein